MSIDPNISISIESAAKSICVSPATIRNWVKLGYIRADGVLVNKASLDTFYKESIGVTKLNARANKLYKRESDTACEYSIERWAEYESTLSQAHRNREGIYYTPSDVVDDMCSTISDADLSDKRFLDPCCGSGNFLVKALELGFAPENIFGYDIDPKAVEIAQQRITDLSGYNSNNILCCDFLDAACVFGEPFDYIYTNPPWGKKMDRTDRLQMVSRYCVGRSSDSSSLFLAASLRHLKDGGQIGFLLPEAFFNVGAYEDIRRELLRCRIDYFIDYGRAFKSLLTKAHAVIVTKMWSEDEQIVCKSEGHIYSRSKHSFRLNPQQIFNFKTNREESDLIENLFLHDHITLKGRATWGLGVVTGDNKRFCSNKPSRDFRAVYRGADITPNGFKSPTLYLNGNLSQYQQTAPAEMYNAPCKLVYKFISSRLCFLCDREQRLLLNSANFLILDDDFPISNDELVKLLNSDFMNWLFQKIFSTHKILRGNLEALPLLPDALQGGLFDEDSYLNCLNIKRTKQGYSLKVLNLLTYDSRE